MYIWLWMLPLECWMGWYYAMASLLLRSSAGKYFHCARLFYFVLGNVFLYRSIIEIEFRWKRIELTYIYISVGHIRLVHVWQRKRERERGERAVRAQRRFGDGFSDRISLLVKFKHHKGVLGIAIKPGTWETAHSLHATPTLHPAHSSSRNRCSNKKIIIRPEPSHPTKSKRKMKP